MVVDYCHNVFCSLEQAGNVTLLLLYRISILGLYKKLWLSKSTRIHRFIELNIVYEKPSYSPLNKAKS